MLLVEVLHLWRAKQTAREHASEGRTCEVRKGGFSRLPQMERFDPRLTPFTLGLCRTNHNGPLAAIIALSPELREKPWERGCPFQCRHATFLLTT